MAMASSNRLSLRRWRSLPTPLFIFSLLVLVLLPELCVNVNARPYESPTHELTTRASQRIIDGKTYTVERLSAVEQGYLSETFKISGGFPSSSSGGRVPAILKIAKVKLEDGVESDDSDEYEYAESELMGSAEQEVGYLKRPSIDLYLHYEWVPKDKKKKGGEGAAYIVVKDVTAMEEPYNPLYKIYLQNRNVKAKDLTEAALETTFDTLKDFAEKEELLYHDNHQRNVYFLNTLKKAMPIDWGPKGLQPGVEAVSGAERIREFVQDLKQSLKDPYSIRALEEELLRHGEDLREGDTDRTEEFEGEEYELERIDINENRKTFRIKGGYNGQPALMVVIFGEEAGMDVEDQFKEDGLFLASETRDDTDWYSIVIKDNKKGRS